MDGEKNDTSQGSITCVKHITKQMSLYYLINPLILLLILCSCMGTYRISSDIRWIFFPFQNNPKDLDPSYKTDLNL